jgi:hypothetical protein
MGLASTPEQPDHMCLLCVQVAEHKRAVDKMLEDKRAMYEAARAAEQQEEAAKYVHTSLVLSVSSMDIASTN